MQLLPPPEQGLLVLYQHHLRLLLIVTCGQQLKVMIQVTHQVWVGQERQRTCAMTAALLVL
jgi:hypothetical protein